MYFIIETHRLRNGCPTVHEDLRQYDTREEAEEVVRKRAEQGDQDAVEGRMQVRGLE